MKSNTVIRNNKLVKLRISKYKLQGIIPLELISALKYSCCEQLHEIINERRNLAIVANLQCAHNVNDMTISFQVQNGIFVQIKGDKIR